MKDHHIKRAFVNRKLLEITLIIYSPVYWRNCVRRICVFSSDKTRILIEFVSARCISV